MSNDSEIAGYIPCGDQSCDGRVPIPKQGGATTCPVCDAGHFVA